MNISQELEKSLDLLAAVQKDSGEFVTLRRSNVDIDQMEWCEDYPCSFFTGCILYSLLETKHPRADLIVKRGCEYLWRVMLPGVFWRYWPDYKNLIGIDADNTSLFSFILAKKNYPVPRNQGLMQTNADKKGYYYTFYFPRWNNFYKIGFLRYFAGELRDSIRQISHGWVFYNDRETAVAAHVLLYLGENIRTQSCIDQVIQEGLTGKFRVTHYRSDIINYYHISKCFRYGMSSFVKLKATIILFVQKKLSEQSVHFLEYGMLLATLLNYGVVEGIESKIASFIKMNEVKQEPKVYLYNPEGDQEWTSAALNTAIFIEVLSLYESLKMEDHDQKHRELTYK